MRLLATLDEMDGLLTELADVRVRLARPGADADEDTLWELEVALRHLAARAEARADLLRRQIDLVNEQRRSA
jgi:hypothetical protein